MNYDYGDSGSMPDALSQIVDALTETGNGIPLSGLLAYCTLDETSGTRADASGNGNDLTDNGGVGSEPG